MSALPISGYYNSETNKTPTYALHGKNDELFNVDEVEFNFKTSIENGSKINYKILDYYSHFMGCNYVEELNKMVKIMQKELF